MFFVVEIGGMYRVHFGTRKINFIVTQWSTKKRALRNWYQLKTGARSAKSFDEGFLKSLEKTGFWKADN